MEKNFEKLSIEEMSLVSGGRESDMLLGFMCVGAPLAFGMVTGGMGLAVAIGANAAIFGPSCAAMVYSKIVG